MRAILNANAILRALRGNKNKAHAGLTAVQGAFSARTSANFYKTGSTAPAGRFGVGRVDVSVAKSSSVTGRLIERASTSKTKFGTSFDAARARFRAAVSVTKGMTYAATGRQRLRGASSGGAATGPIEGVTYSPSITQGILYDGSSGVNGWYWNRHLKFQWKNLRGDWLDSAQVSQGPTPFGSALVTATGTEKSVTITGLATLVTRWRSGINRGIMLWGTGGGSVNIYSRHDATTAKRPTLTVTASGSGTTTCACTADTTVSSAIDGSDSNNTRIFVDSNPSTRMNALLQFDLSGVSGTVSAAQLNLISSNQFGSNTTVNVYEIDCPLIWIGDGGTPTTGVANNTYWDSEISAQTGVTFARPKNHGLENDYYQYSGAEVTAGVWCRSDAASNANPERVFDTGMRDYVLRGKFINADMGSSSYKYMFSPSLNPANEPDEAYFRQYVKLEADYQTVVDDMKAAGGFYNIQVGAGFDSGEPSNGTNGWRAQPHIGRRSSDASNPYRELHSAATYMYHMDQEGLYGDTADSGIDNLSFFGKHTRWGNGTTYPGFCWQRDRWVCVEQRIRMNTPGSADGILEIWVSGVKVYSRTNLRWRSVSTLKVQSIWFNFYHGGVTPPNVDMHWRLAAPVIGSQYIGPMRQEALPAWALSLTGGQLATVTTANTFMSVDPCPTQNCSYNVTTNFRMDGIIDAYSGGVFNPYQGKWGSSVFHGGGHLDYWGNEVVTLNLETLTFAVISPPSTNIEPPNLTFGEWADGKPMSAHTYDNQVTLPPWDSGGTRGALFRPSGLALGRTFAPDSGYSHRYRFGTGWDRFTATAATNGVGPSGMAAYDPRRRRVWWRGQSGNMSGLNYVSLTAANHGFLSFSANNGGDFEPDGHVMIYVPSRDLLLITGRPGTGGANIIRYVDLNNQSNGAPTATLSTALPSSYSSSMDYVPDIDRVVLYANADKGAVFEVQIPTTLTSTWTVTRRPFTGVTTLQSGGSLFAKRWTYNVKLKCFVFMPNSGRGQTPFVVYAYRPFGVS